MPTVRRAERQVVNDPLRGGMKQAAATEASEGAGVEIARAEKFGAAANLGERVTRFGASMFAGIVEQERQNADQTALLKASNALSDWKNERLLHPTTGALNLKAEASLQIPEDIRTEFVEVAGRIEAGLTTDAQRAAFARLKSQEWQGIDLTVRRHVYQEMTAFRAQELKAHVDNSVNAAIASAFDPKLVQVELQKATSAIQTNGPTLGLGKEAVDQQVREVTSRTHVGVIANLLSKDNDRGAQAYFEATKDQIAGEKLDEVQRAIEEGSLRGEGQRKADEIAGAGGTLKEQLEKARQIDDPKLRDQVEQRIEHKAILQDREEKEYAQQQERSAYDILDRSADVSKIPPSMWATFDGPTRSAMRHYATMKAKGEPIETDLGVYYSLMQQARERPQGFVGVNLLQYRTKLGESEFKQLAGLQNAIATQDPKAEKDLAEFQSREDLLNATLEQHGINPKAKPGSDEAKEIAQLRRLLDQRVAFIQSDGKKATNADIQAEVDGILGAKISTPGWLWGSTEKRVLELTNKDIPASDREAITGALRRRGRPVTDEQILNAYIQGQLLRAQRERR